MLSDASEQIMQKDHYRHLNMSRQGNRVGQQGKLVGDLQGARNRRTYQLEDAGLELIVSTRR